MIARPFLSSSLTLSLVLALGSLSFFLLSDTTRLLTFTAMSWHITSYGIHFTRQKKDPNWYGRQTVSPFYMCTRICTYKNTNTDMTTDTHTHVCIYTCILSSVFLPITILRLPPIYPFLLRVRHMYHDWTHVETYHPYITYTAIITKLYSLQVTYITYLDINLQNGTLCEEILETKFSVRITLHVLVDVQLFIRSSSLKNASYHSVNSCFFHEDQFAFFPRHSFSLVVVIWLLYGRKLVQRGPHRRGSIIFQLVQETHDIVRFT